MSPALLVLLLAGCRPVLAPRVAAPAQDPSDAWGALLGRVVTPDGFVDYDALEADREPLDRYVAWVARPKRRAGNRHGALLDAYNALVLYAVLEDGRPASVLDVDGWLPAAGSGFFFERAFLVDGQPTSLAELHHEHLRHKVIDYRDHAALGCGAASGPPLRPELYQAQGLDRRLDAQMTRWVMDEARGVRIEGDEAVFNAIFDRYGDDFELQAVGADLCAVAARFAVGERKAQLRALSARGCPHRFAPFDWSLNDSRGREPLPVPDLQGVEPPDPEPEAETDATP